MSIEEAILDKIRRLPPSKQEDLLHYADKLLEPPRWRRVPDHDRSREMKWVHENEDKYPDYWVAIEGERVIALDLDADKVFAAARAENLESPFVVHLHPKDELPFGGW